MKSKRSAFSTTALGGLIFLVPFVIVIVIGGKALALMRAVAQPIAVQLGIEHIGAVAVIDMLAVVMLIVVCCLAGLLATRGRSQRLQQTFDRMLLELFPRYTFIKSLTESLGVETIERTLKTVMVHFDDQSQIAFEVERQDGWVVVYLPGSPDPWSGAVSLVKPERVQDVDADFKTAVKRMRLAGRGAGALA